MLTKEAIEEMTRQSVVNYDRVRDVQKALEALAFLCEQESKKYLLEQHDKRLCGDYSPHILCAVAEEIRRISAKLP